jgi:hypothetical protein
LHASGLGAYHGREAAGRAVPAIAGSTHYQYRAADLTAERAGLMTQVSRRRGPEGGRQGYGEGVICRKPAPHDSDPAVAADRQPAPFGANHSGIRRAMSEPRTALAFQLTWR